MKREFSGRIITSPQAEPFYGKLVVENGRIAELIPHQEKPESDCPYIAPGFIDAHTHPLELGLQELFVNLAGAESIDEVLALIRDGLKEKGVMLGFNLDPEQLAEARYPHLAELDLITQEIPVLVYRIDGHSAVVNSPGLKLAFKDSEPTGIEKDNGKPSGVLRGRAYEQASRVFKQKLKPETLQAALKCAADIAASRGVTTFAALIGSDNTEEQTWLTMLDTLAGLKPRAVPFIQTRNPELARQFGLPRVGGCLLVDGSFGSHTAALTTEYQDAPGNQGISYFTDNQLQAFLKQADDLSLQTALHAIGDRAVKQLVRCHEQARNFQPGNPLRHRIEHAELLNQNLIERIAHLELVLCVQPAFEALWGGPDRLYAKRLGNRWQSTNPYRSLLDAGVILAGGSDAPITPIDPLKGIKAATEHPNQKQNISGHEAFAMFTTAAAYSLGLELRTGRLEPGYEADFVILSHDPKTNPECRLIATYQAGACLYQSKPEVSA